MWCSEDGGEGAVRDEERDRGTGWTTQDLTDHAKWFGCFQRTVESIEGYKQGLEHTEILESSL